MLEDKRTLKWIWAQFVDNYSYHPFSNNDRHANLARNDETKSGRGSMKIENFFKNLKINEIFN